MAGFLLPDSLTFNRCPIEHPTSYFHASGCSSWLYLIGDEFAAMRGGMSYEDVLAATSNAQRVISDPPRTLNLALAREHVAALDSLPRPTLISCRSGPRASAVAYMYAGLKVGADPAEVLASAEKDGAPFCVFDEYKTWVRDAIDHLSER